MLGTRAGPLMMQLLMEMATMEQVGALHGRGGEAAARQARRAHCRVSLGCTSRQLAALPGPSRSAQMSRTRRFTTSWAVLQQHRKTFGLFGPIACACTAIYNRGAVGG